MNTVTIRYRWSLDAVEDRPQEAHAEIDRLCDEVDRLYSETVRLEEECNRMEKAARILLAAVNSCLVAQGIQPPDIKRKLTRTIRAFGN